MSQCYALSINPLIHNKPSEWRPEYARGWQPVEVDLAGLRGIISQGTAFVAAAMRSDHRSSAAFLHSDLAVVDIDHGLSLEGFAAHPLSSYALLTYTTARHQPEAGEHRFRIIFCLPRRVSDPDLYKALITLLTRALGSDRSCTDPCRLFYACDYGEQQVWHGDACLPEDMLEQAERELQHERARFNSREGEYDDITIQQAVFVLEQVIEPTRDGERDRFVRITAAAASAGSALYSAWSDWAARGHHGQGKNSRQTSEKFFRGFSGRTTLATLFFFAAEQDPDWRKQLPEELRSSGVSSPLPSAGYGHEDFLGDDDSDAAPAPSVRTASIFEEGGSDWSALTAPAATATADTDDDEDDDDDPGPPPSARGKGSKGKASSGDEIEVIKHRLQLLYPGLRLNQLSLELEYGPRDEPQTVHDPSTAYVRISRGAGQVFAKTHVFDIAQVVGWENRYNPVRTYLEHCAASAEPISYFGELASTLLGVPDEGPENPRMPDGRLLADVILGRFLVGAVARALNPGCSHGWMPILVGPQNLGKSNFFQYLTPPSPLSGTYPWVATLQQGISYVKDKPHVLHAGWIVVIDEVERYFKRRYTEEFKNLVTVPVDRSARKWENERNFPRAFVLAGATNETNFMVDPTGNRRFMPVTVLGRVPSPENPSVRIIDLDRVKQDRDGIWAAAYREYLDAPVHEFSSYELTLIAEYVSGFSSDTPLTEALRQVLERNVSFLHDGRPSYTMTDIYRWLDLSLENQRYTSNAVSDELKKMGYELKRRRIGGSPNPVRFWQREGDRRRGLLG